MGWFPSGKLKLVLSDDENGIKEILSGNVHLEDEFQYNLPEHVLNKKMRINSDDKGIVSDNSKKVLLKEEWG
eukprot:15349117-Ditylum_brightwellii.AAC.1